MNPFKRLEDGAFKRWFEWKYKGLKRDHVSIQQYDWTIAKWNQKEFDSVTNIKYGKKGNFIESMNKLWNEVIVDKLNKKRTTISPLQYYTNSNILLLVGLEESSRRDTSDAPENTTGVQFLGFGTDNTSELESQTGLISAYGSRLDIDVKGQRSTPAAGQTSKFNVTATDVELTVPVTLKEAVLYNKLTSGKGHARIQYPDFLLTAGDRITVQINELHRNL